MVFKLENSNGVLENVSVQTNPAFLETQDSTLDTGTVTLAFNNSATPIEPNKKFVVYYSDSDYIPFIVVNDTVTPVKRTDPLLYKHELLITQNTQALTKKLVRNSVFSRSISERPTAFCSSLFWTALDRTDGAITFGTTAVRRAGYQYEFTLIENETIKSFKLVFNSMTNFLNVINCDTLMLGDPPYDMFYSVDDTFHRHGSKRTIDTVKQAVLRIRRWDNNVNTVEKLINIGKDYSNNNEILITDSTIINDLFANRVASTKYIVDIYDIEKNKIDLSSFSTQDLELNLTGGWRSLTPRVFHPLLTSIQCDIIFNSVYQTLYDVLETLLKQAKKTYNGLSVYSDSQLFTLPASGNDYTTLTTIEAPEFSFTQKDLFGCVTEVLNYIDAVPSIDKDGVLHIEYLNDNSKEKVTNLKFSDQTKSLNENYHVDKFVAEYQNARQTSMVYSPVVGRNDSTRSLTGKNYGIVARTDYIFHTEHKIDVVNKMYVEMLIEYAPVLEFVEDIWKYKYTYKGALYDKIDISSAVYEEKEYALLKYGNGSNTFPNKNNTIYYSQGSNEIVFGDTVDANGNKQQDYTIKYAIAFALCHKYGLVGNDTSAGALPNQFQIYGTAPSLTNNLYDDYSFGVGYYGIYDGKFAIESPEKKYDGDLIISQDSGQIQLNRMGLNMLGLISKLGNVEFTAVLPLTSFHNRIKKGTIWLDTDGNRYIANKVKTTIGTSENKAVCEVQFVKNFNELSIFTRVDKARRFYEIDSSLIQKGYEYVVEYMYFSTESFTNIDAVVSASGYTYAQITTSAITSNALSYITRGFFEFGNALSVKAGSCVIRTYTDENDTNPISLGSLNNDFTLFDSISCPFHCYGAGNMICFEAGYDSPINAGDRIQKTTTGFFSANQYLCVPTLYTNKNGIADMFDITILSSADGNVGGSHYPLCLPSINNDIIKINKYHYYKKANEIFRFNFEIACLALGNEEIYFGDSFISKNTIITGKEGFLGQAKLRLWLDINKDYSIIDKHAHGVIINPNLSISGSTTHSGCNFSEIVIRYTTSSFNFNNWCLADLEGNILICGNFKTMHDTIESTITIRAFASRYRL